MEILLSRNCSRDEFFLLYVKLLEERLHGATLEMTGDSSVRIVLANGKEATAYLDNLWISYSGGTEQRRELLERHLRVASLAGAAEEPFQKERLIPVIKDFQFISQNNSKDETAMEHLCGDLWVVYSEDLPDRVRTVKRETLREAGLDNENLREFAKRNLRRILPPPERFGDGPWYLIVAGGNYTASLLLFELLWDDVKELVEGNVVAVAPARDVILFSGSESREGIAAIRERAAEIIATGNYLISDTLLIRSGGRWDVFNAN